jgi:hypothetical protein
MPTDAKEDVTRRTPTPSRPSTIHGAAMSWMGRPTEALASLQGLRTRLVEHGDEAALPFLAFLLSPAACARGDLVAARRYAEEGLEAASQVGTDVTRAYALTATAYADAYSSDRRRHQRGRTGGHPPREGRRSRMGGAPPVGPGVLAPVAGRRGRSGARATPGARGSAHCRSPGTRLLTVRPGRRAGVGHARRPRGGRASCCPNRRTMRSQAATVRDPLRRSYARQLSAAISGTGDAHGLVAALGIPSGTRRRARSSSTASW